VARPFQFAAAISGTLILLFVLYWFMSYRASEFRGAGPMEDTGFFSYYRYHAPLGNFPFYREGTYEFRFSGLPSEKMVLQFYVTGYSDKNRSEIQSLKTLLTTEIKDSAGNTICTASGSPAPQNEQGWTLMSSGSQAAYWHPLCAGQPFARRTEYYLRVTVQAPDPKTPKVEVRAMLEGGGNELP
jgi:hypothetical protein